MEFMGKWIMWSHGATGYLVPLYLSGPQPILTANPSTDIRQAVYNIYSGPNAGELLIQADHQIMTTGAESWLQCATTGTWNGFIVANANLAGAMPLTRQQNGDWTNLLYESTPLYVVSAVIVTAVMVGNQFGNGDPDLNITVKTQSLDAYKESKSAVGADFSNIDFTGADLTGIDFTNADFTGAILTGARFDSTNKLAGVKFVNADLTNLNLAGLDISGTNFTGAKLNGLNVGSANLSGAIMPDLDLTQLAQSSFSNPPTLAGTSNQLTNLSGSKIPFALLNKNWQWLDLRSANIPDLPQSISQLQASGAKLSGLNRNVLTGISLQSAILNNAVMDGLGLSGIDLTNASLIDASLHGTTITNAKLSGANLTGAQLGSLGQLFTLPSSVESALNSGQVSAITPYFTQNGITLSSDLTLDMLAENRVWELNDAGNHIIYTIRLEIKTNGTQVLTVYAPALAGSLVGAYMPDAVLTGVNLYGALASSSQFYGSNARIDGSAILEEAQLNDSNLSNLNLTQARLLGTDLSNSHLFNAKFNKADLTPSASGTATNLSYCNLQGADFTDAKLYGANLTNAAVAINTPTTGNPQQGGVYLFTLPYAGDSNTLQQYIEELNIASELNTAKSLTLLHAAFKQNDITLSTKATVSIDTPGKKWLIDNDSQDPQNFSLGYVRFFLKLNGSALEVYGTAVRIERLGDNNQLQIDTEDCNVTVLAVTNMSGETLCPNGSKLSVNQAQSGVSWDERWLRARVPPSPPTCVPTDYSWCPQTQAQTD